MNIITMKRQGWLNVYITSWTDGERDVHELHYNKKAHCGEHDGGMIMEGTQ